jgi:nicotinate-nucleotide adenylyltransferase
MPTDTPPFPPETCSDIPEQAQRAPLRIFFGGTFDPPHHGHARLPDRVRTNMKQERAWLIYVPAARSPHKQHQPADDAHRLAMLRLALRDLHRTCVWTGELDRAAQHPGQPSYWVDTWTQLKRLEMNGDNRFIIGTDQALAMHRWHRYDEIWRDAIVMLRDHLDDADAFLNSMRDSGVWSADDLDHWRDRTVALPTIDASSSSIRTQLSDAGTRENPIAGLDDRVHKYILEQGLYTLA